MIGMILWAPPERGKRNIVLKERSVLHMRVLAAEIARGPGTSRRTCRRRALAAARRLHRAGVVRAVLPEDFPFREEVEACGVQPVSTLPLRRALAAEWIFRELERRGLSPGSAKAAVSAAQITGELVRTVTELSLRNRYVLLDLPYGGAELCRQLRREYGVSLLLGPDREQLEQADVLALFDPREDLRPAGGLVLTLYGDQGPLPPLVLPPALEERLPAGADRGQLLSALRQAGALRPGQIAVGTLPPPEGGAEARFGA